ncbi:Uncharacterised protein [Klebsiella oxytoca]|nr:Uncharacterised protein [Klebsiella oxytoca]
MDDLALQVAQVNIVVVDDPDGPHAGSGKVEEGRRAEPAGSDHQDAGVLQPALAECADLRNDEVPRVPLHLFGRKSGRRIDEGGR